MAAVAACASVDLPPEEIESYQQLIAERCVRETLHDWTVNSSRKIKGSAIHINTLEDLGGGWIRLATTMQRLRDSVFVHKPTQSIVCGERNWPGVERANARLAAAAAPTTQSVRRTLTYTIAGDPAPKTGFVEWPEPFGKLVPFEVDLGAPYGLCKGAATQRDWSMSCEDGLSAAGDDIRFADGRGGGSGAGVDSLGRSVTWRIADQ